MTQTENEMKQNGTLINELFELNDIDDNVELPESLNVKLYKIADNKQKKHTWRYPVSAAASILIGAMTVMAFYQAPREPNELDLAREELALAFEYLDVTQHKIEPHVIGTLSHNLQELTVQPVFESATKVEF